MRRASVVSLSLLLLALSVGPTVAQPGSETSPLPPAGIEPGASAMPTTETPALEFDEPTWTRLDPGRGPAAREDHTWTVDGAGRHAYLFGGRDGGTAFDDLWRFDLETDTWERLSPAGRSPSARFGHSAVWVADQGLVVFAGQRGTDFFGDLWAFDPAAGRWNELPDRGGKPRPRYGSCAIVGPDGRLWISHGFTFTGRFDDTRAYNFSRRRWASITPDGRRPGRRCLHDCFTSAAGQMVLYGGQDDAQRALGDLWVTRPDGRWRRASDPRPTARRLYAVTEAGDQAFIFGGAGRDDQPLGDLWAVDRETLDFRRIEVPGRSPSARSAATLITDAARGRLLLFGGEGRSASADLWQLTDPSGEADPGAEGDPGSESSATPAASVEPDTSAAAEASLAPEASGPAG